MNHKFYGGVHPHGHKELSSGSPISQLNQAPAQVVIPMSMHVGAPCTPIVAKGDTVLVGQQIGETAGLGAPIHASVSGTVAAVEPRPHPNGELVNAVVIENDFQNTLAPSLSDGRSPRDFSPEELLDLVKRAGITGMGGAGFPTHVKLSGAIGKVDTIILNGAECEPYITADHRLMLECGNKIIGGARIISRILGLNKAYIGIEANKADAIAALRRILPAKDGDVEVRSLRVRYPQGAEKQLIQTFTGRQIPPGKLPADVKCAVFNVSTAAAIYDAVYSGAPLTHRVVTVTGDCIATPRNLWAPIGTPMEHLIAEAGGFRQDPDRILAGGPMMGNPQYDLSVPVLKGGNAILCLSKKAAAKVADDPVCIRCGRCMDACPMHLQPLYIHLYASAGRFRELSQFNVNDCIECGSCAYGCPARIPLVQGIRAAKNQLRALSQQKK